jgi:hypothetical protein
MNPKIVIVLIIPTSESGPERKKIHYNFFG